MANRNFPQSRIYTGHVMPVQLDASISIGATGAVSSFTGAFISSVTRLAAGIYQIQMQDNYSNFYFGVSQMVSPVTGSALAIDSSSAALSVGTLYQITTVGNNTLAAWQALGLPAGLTPAVGMCFVALATGSGAAGTGRVKAVGSSGIARVELGADPALEAAPMIPNTGAAGAIVVVQCLQAQIGAATTQGAPLQYAPADPAQGSIMKLSFLFSNSSVQVGGS